MPDQFLFKRVKRHVGHRQLLGVGLQRRASDRIVCEQAG
ncbi:hypothetical protein MicB006_3657 [Micromonospora sp. B006]|nr:hypothetical protein MicB006_3657 [Micromonospora sp. B006]